MAAGRVAAQKLFDLGLGRWGQFAGGNQRDDLVPFMTPGPCALGMTTVAAIVAMRSSGALWLLTLRTRPNRPTLL